MEHQKSNGLGKILKGNVLYVADIAVVTTEQVDPELTMGQVDFFDSNGSLQKGTVKPLADVQAVEYDPIQEQLFVSDDAHANYSIFTVNLRGIKKLSPLIRSK